MQRKMYQFLLLTGKSLAEVLQQLPGSLQEITKGQDFDITAITAVPEVLQSLAINGQPRLQLSVVFAVKLIESEDLPGMGSDKTFVGTMDLPAEVTESMKAVKAAAAKNGISFKGQYSQDLAREIGDA